MKTNQFLVLAALFLGLTLSSCEKHNVVPTASGKTGTDTNTGGSGGSTPPANGGGTQTPGTGTPAAPSPEAGAMLTQMDVIQLGYDAQKRLISYDSYQNNDQYTIVYEGEKPVRINYESGHHLIYLWSADKIVGAVQYWKELEIRRYEFEYNGNKLAKMKNSSWYEDYTRGWMVVNNYEYDSKGNLVKLTTRAAQSNNEADLGEPSYISWGNYDNNPNPMPFVEGGLYLPGVKLFENNPGYRQTGYKETFTYAYHASGLPSEKSIKIQGYEHVAPAVLRYQYQ